MPPRKRAFKGFDSLPISIAQDGSLTARSAKALANVDIAIENYPAYLRNAQEKGDSVTIGFLAGLAFSGVGLDPENTQGGVDVFGKPLAAAAKAAREEALPAAPPTER